MQQERIEQRLRKIILENEGDRDDIYSDVFDFVKPLIDALTGIAQPSGVYSKDPLVHAQNTIKNCEQIANSALNEALEITSE